MAMKSTYYLIVSLTFCLTLNIDCLPSPLKASHGIAAKLKWFSTGNTYDTRMPKRAFTYDQFSNEVNKCIAACEKCADELETPDDKVNSLFSV